MLNIVAATPLKLSEDASVKFVPVRVTVEPGAPELPVTLSFVGDVMLARGYDNPGGLVDTYGPVYRVARGGSYARHGDLVRCARRHGWYPSDHFAMGFRLAETA